MSELPTSIMALGAGAILNLLQNCFCDSFESEAVIRFPWAIDGAG
jgi:hypothetical protein